MSCCEKRLDEEQYDLVSITGYWAATSNCVTHPYCFVTFNLECYQCEVQKNIQLYGEPCLTCSGLELLMHHSVWHKEREYKSKVKTVGLLLLCSTRFNFSFFPSVPQNPDFIC